MNDLIDRQVAIEAIAETIVHGETLGYGVAEDIMYDLPSAQPEPFIPLSWIEKQIDWLKNMDNEFSNINAMNISLLVKKWRKENGKDE